MEDSKTTEEYEEKIKALEDEVSELRDTLFKIDDLCDDIRRLM